MTDRVAAQLPLALELVGAVRDGGPDAVADALARTNDLAALVVMLAALVPDDQTPSELLAWWNPDAGERRKRRAEQRRLRRMRQRDEPVVRATQPCGTHAAYVRHWKRSETPDEDCVAAERLYQRERKRSKSANKDLAVRPLVLGGAGTSSGEEGEASPEDTHEDAA